MKVTVFSAHSFEIDFLKAANQKYNHDVTFLKHKLTAETAKLAENVPAISVWTNDNLKKEVLAILAKGRTKLIALRTAGFNHVDLVAAKELGFAVLRVPAYSPYSVAEHAVGLILALNRKIYRAYNRVREGNFDIEGLLGFDIHGKTVGVIGTGKIGAIVTKIISGFGCNILGYDIVQNPDCERAGMKYVALNELFAKSDIITLHCPLTPQTHHIINEQAISQMKNGVMLVNTGRGALIDTKHVIKALKNGKIGYLGLDVYEEEDDLFFTNLSDKIIQDDIFMRLITFPNVLITGHQAFFTREAITNIAETTMKNISDFEKGIKSPNEVSVEKVK